MPIKRSKQKELEKYIQQLRDECDARGIIADETVIRRLAHHLIVLNETEEKWMRGEDINLELFYRGTNALLRFYKELGLLEKRPQAKKREPQSLDEYLHNGAGGAR